MTAAAVRTRNPTEYAEQCSVYTWAQWASVELPPLRWLTGSLNGVNLSIGTARKAKAAGQLPAGYPDLFLPYVRFRADGLGVWPGCYIELKRRSGGHLDPEQKVWRDWLQAQGYQWHRCNGADAAKRVLLDYVGATDEQKGRLL